MLFSFNRYPLSACFFFLFSLVRLINNVFDFLFRGCELEGLIILSVMVLFVGSLGDGLGVSLRILCDLRSEEFEFEFEGFGI